MNQLKNQEFVNKIYDMYNDSIVVSGRYVGANDKIVVKTKYGYHKVRPSKLLQGWSPTIP